MAKLNINPKTQKWKKIVRPNSTKFWIVSIVSLTLSAASLSLSIINFLQKQ